MGKKIKSKNMTYKIKSVIILVTVALLLSCHSEYLSLDYSIHHGGCISADSSFGVFALTTKAYRQATGISRFPDGGFPDYIISDMGIYYLDMKALSVEKIVELKDLAALIGSTRSLWKMSLNISGDSVFYKVQPVSDWSLYNSGSPEKQDKINDIKEKYESVHIYDIQTKEIRESSDLTEVICPENQKLGIMDISRILKEMPLSEMGFVLKEIYPKTDEEYIDETIYGKNNSSLTKRAVFEQIISKLSKEEMSGLLKKMDEYRNSLEGLERTEYDLY